MLSKTKTLRLVSHLMIGLLIAPTWVYAVGFGSLRVNSNLGEKLDIEVELVSVSPAELGTLEVSLASKPDYFRAKIPYPDNPSRFLFDIVEGLPGQYYVSITSPNPVNDAFLHFLFAADWSGGKVVREFTALLDPPLYSGNQAAEVDVTAILPTEEPVVQSQVAQSSESTPITESSASGFSGATTPSVITVKSGDTLFRVIERLALPASISPYQALSAVLEANPRAFVGGNMNQLYAGTTLKIPDFNNIAQIDEGDAIQEFNVQYEQYSRHVAEITKRSTVLEPNDENQNSTKTQADEPVADTKDDFALAEGQSEIALQVQLAKQVTTIDGGFVLSNIESENDTVTESGELAITATDDIASENVELESSRLENDIADDAVEQGATTNDDLIALNTELQNAESDNVTVGSELTQTDYQPQLRISQDTIDEQIASNIESDSVSSIQTAPINNANVYAADDVEQHYNNQQIATLKTQLSTLDESLLVTGAQSEEVTLGLQQIQSQISKLIAITDSNLALSQNRAAGVETKSASGGENAGPITASEGTQIATNESAEIAEPATTAIKQPDIIENTNSSQVENSVSENADFANTESVNPVAGESQAANNSAAEKEPLLTAFDGSSQESGAERYIKKPEVLGSIVETFRNLSSTTLKILAALIAIILGLVFYRSRKRKQGTIVQPRHTKRKRDSAKSSDDETRTSDSVNESAMEVVGTDSLDQEDASERELAGDNVIANIREWDEIDSQKENSLIESGLVDSLAEADVYLAYGRDEQAIHVLKDAYEENPERIELGEKLLEIYYKHDDRIAFDELATKFKSRLNNNQISTWLNVASMGRELSRGNSLYDEISEVPVDEIEDELSFLGFNKTSKITKAYSNKPVDAPSIETGVDEKLTGPTNIGAEERLYDAGNGSDIDTAVGSLNGRNNGTAIDEAQARIESSLDRSVRDPFGSSTDGESESNVRQPNDLGYGNISYGTGYENMGFAPMPEATSNLSNASTDHRQAHQEQASSNVGQESDTALELATAYLDLGEADIARGFIEEVLVEGNDIQKEKARELLKSLQVGAQAHL